MLSKRKPKNSAKNLSAALQAVNNPLENQLEYINSNRLSKPNLLDAPKPSKLLAPIGLHRTLSSLTYRILQLAHCINQINWLSFELLPKHQKPSQSYKCGKVRIWLKILSRV